MRKPYLVIVPLVVAAFLVVFYWDKTRVENELKKPGGGEIIVQTGGGFYDGSDLSESRSTIRKHSRRQKKYQRIRTDSGLIYQVLKEGDGVRPGPTDKVQVIYRGNLEDGTEFDRSVGGRPISFRLNQVIKGWGEGLQLMKVGAKYRFIIPPELAYGGRGAPPKIGPNETLIFDVELVSVEK